MTRPTAKPQKKSAGQKPASAASGGALDQPASASAAPQFLPALKPRKRLFTILLIAYLAWVGLLLALYAKTVYPMRHPAATAPSKI